MQNTHNVWSDHSIIKCKIHCWQACVLKPFNTKNYAYAKKNKKTKILLQALSCPVLKCNYISVFIHSSTVRCRKLDTSSLRGAKLAFGSVMSELLDSFSAGILPFFFFLTPPPNPRPVSSHIAAAVSDEASHPAEHRRSLVPLSAWQLVTCIHPIPSLPPSLCLFLSHFPLISSPCF